MLAFILLILSGNRMSAQSPGSGPRPAIIGVTDGFNFSPGLAPNTWSVVFGRDLSAETRDWTSAVQGTQLPTTLGGVSVTVNNLPAPVFFISPGQINFLPPNDIGTGDMTVVVRNTQGTSDPFTVRAATVKPAFYAPFAQNNRFFVTAVSLTGELVGTRGSDPRVTRAARPGEILLIFGTGFGPTNPVVPVDRVVVGAPLVTTPVRIRFGDVVANVAGAGNLVAVGLYQFNVTVPETLANGEYPLIAEIGGVASGANVFLPVQR